MGSVPQPGPGIPAEAIQAALTVMTNWTAHGSPPTRTATGYEDSLVAAMLAAAAPALYAHATTAERERIRQLAIARGQEIMRVGRTCGADAEALWSFADLLEPGTNPTPTGDPT